MTHIYRSLKCDVCSLWNEALLYSKMHMCVLREHDFHFMCFRFVSLIRVRLDPPSQFCIEGTCIIPSLSSFWHPRMLINVFTLIFMLMYLIYRVLRAT